MSLSPNRISIRDHMIATAAGAIPFFDAVKSLGINAIEIQVDPDLTTPHVRQPGGAPFSLATDAGLAMLQEALRQNAVRVSALLLMSDFSSEKPAGQVAWAVRSTHIAAKLGAPAVRVDPLTRNKELPREKVRDNFIAGIKNVLNETAGTGVDLGMENHGPFGNDPVFIDEVLATVGDSRLGLTLDTGNFYWWGAALEELYALLARYAPRTKHTHIKNINYPPELAAARRPIGLDYGKYCCPLDEGNIDLRRAIRILDDAGYRRDLCIENEMLGKLPPDQRLDVLRRDVQAVRGATA